MTTALIIAALLGLGLFFLILVGVVLRLGDLEQAERNGEI